MGDVVDRGTRDNPKWFVRYVDTDGTRRMRLVGDARTKTGVKTCAQATCRDYQERPRNYCDNWTF